MSGKLIQKKGFGGLSKDLFELSEKLGSLRIRGLYALDFLHLNIATGKEFCVERFISARRFCKLHFLPTVETVGYVQGDVSEKRWPLLQRQNVV